MSKCKYKVSIAVPVYGVEAYVGKCAESLFSQTYTDIWVFKRLIQHCVQD